MGGQETLTQSVRPSLLFNAEAIAFGYLLIFSPPSLRGHDLERLASRVMLRFNSF